jgi:anaerobic magnesium-protoporphyrin IX monomethyl ester cyclase
MARHCPSIAFVKPPSECVEDDHLEPPLGLLYLAAAVREHGFDDVALCDLSDCCCEAEAEEKIAKLSCCSVFAIQVYCTNHEQTKRIIAIVRRCRPDAYVVLGGPNPSALPEFTLADTGADTVVVGEGEDAFVECLESYRTGTPRRGIVPGHPRHDPDCYPLPARDLVVYENYSRRLLGQPVVSLLSSRGCPHRCVFCNSMVMGGGAPIARYRSPGNLVAEIQSLRERYRAFRFNDDCFSTHPRLPELLAGLADLDILFRAFARVEDLTPHTCRALRRAGCMHVAVGLESLDPANLRMLGKARQAGHESNVRRAVDAGIAVRGYFMVGLPHDTDQGIERHFQLAAQLGLAEFSVYPLIPYPGTQIAQHPERFGYTILNEDFRDYVQIGTNRRTCYALRHRNFGPEDVARWRDRAEEILLRGGAIHSVSSQVAI